MLVFTKDTLKEWVKDGIHYQVLDLHDSFTHAPLQVRAYWPGLDGYHIKIEPKSPGEDLRPLIADLQAAAQRYVDDPWIGPGFMAVFLDGYYAPRRRAGMLQWEDALCAVALILFGITTGAVPNDIEHGVVVVGGRLLS
jgi:hypothetical protein